MLLRSDTFTFQFNSLTSFSVIAGRFDTNIQRPDGQPFWWFASRRSQDCLELWGFGFQGIFCKSPSGQVAVL